MDGDNVVTMVMFIYSYLMDGLVTVASWVQLSRIQYTNAGYARISPKLSAAVNLRGIHLVPVILLLVPSARLPLLSLLGDIIQRSLALSLLALPLLLLLAVLLLLQR